MYKWPKTTLLAVWPRDAQGLATPGRRSSSKVVPERTAPCPLHFGEAEPCIPGPYPHHQTTPLNCPADEPPFVAAHPPVRAQSPPSLEVSHLGSTRTSQRDATRSLFLTLPPPKVRPRVGGLIRRQEPMCPGHQASWGSELSRCSFREEDGTCRAGHSLKVMSNVAPVWTAFFIKLHLTPENSLLEI